MTLKEAIKELDDLIVATEEQHRAVRLGIEALRRCEWNYANPMRADLRRLPSETEEGK